MDTVRAIRFVGVGLLMVGLVVAFFEFNFYYTCYFRISHAAYYDCGDILTFPQLIASVGLIVVSFIMFVTAPVKRRKKVTNLSV
ncbi:MAG: hypothetical protein M1503_09670 [Thaumarchaeota archaeon]|nr:hypothetical protein [Nitrososphaerota archaeon]MCL5318507.1 hypothetical protein [Nitrososphaerota archaeon]